MVSIVGKKKKKKKNLIKANIALLNNGNGYQRKGFGKNLSNEMKQHLCSNRVDVKVHIYHSQKNNFTSLLMGQLKSTMHLLIQLKELSKIAFYFF